MDNIKFSKDIKDIKCPYCNKRTLRKKDKGLIGGLHLFPSVHRACPHCDKGIVLGYRHDDGYMCISEKMFDNITK